MIDKVITRIDEINSEDPNLEEWEGNQVPKELIYGQRMTEMLTAYKTDSSIELQIAVRGQHIRRWHMPRADFPMDRKGYLKWRTMLKMYHGKLLSEIMIENGFEQGSAKRVAELVSKNKLKTDKESMQLEDIACLVFLKYYFSAFAQQHNEEKIISIVQKTWGKMTEKGHEMALDMNYEEEDLNLIKKALAGG